MGASDQLQAPDSPLHRLSTSCAEPKTPSNQHIPDPLLQPPSAPRKPRNLSHWVAREDSPCLRDYFLSLPFAERLETAASKQGHALPARDLQECFSLAAAKRASEPFPTSEPGRKLCLVPQLAAGTDAAKRGSLCMRNRPAGRLACFSCGSGTCTHTDLLADAECPLTFAEYLTGHCDDAAAQLDCDTPTSSSSSGSFKRQRMAGTNPEAAAKRRCQQHAQPFGFEAEIPNKATAACAKFLQPSAAPSPASHSFDSQPCLKAP